MAKPIKTTARKAFEPISRREAFVTGGALSARTHTGPGDQLHFGKMSEGSRKSIEALNDIDYVVHSYATPIGVHSQSQGWVIPEDKYSTTTTQHQNQVRRGASMGE